MDTSKNTTINIYNILINYNIVFCLDFYKNYGCLTSISLFLAYLIIVIITIIKRIIPFRLNIARGLFGKQTFICYKGNQSGNNNDKKIKKDVSNNGLKKTDYENPSKDKENNKKKSKKRDRKSKKKKKEIKKSENEPKDNKSKSTMLMNGKTSLFTNDEISIQIKKDDYELNNLLFEKAILYDDRSFCRIYYSFFIRESILMFTFNFNDYNLIHLIFARFFLLLLSTVMAMNVFFYFADSIIKYVNKDEDKYNYVDMALQIGFSSITSYALDTIIGFLTLTDKYYYKMKYEENKENNKHNLYSFMKTIKIKIIVFFTIGTIIFAFYCYLVSAFCITYYQTQLIFLIKSSITIGIITIFPFIIYLFVALLQFIALKANSSCLYNFSKLIPMC